MRNIFVSLIGFVFFIGDPIVCLAAPPPKIGVSLPLTGPAATYGTDVRNILSFLNEQRIEGPFDLVVEDDKCDPKEAASIAQKFTQVDRVAAVIGLPCSGTVLASAPVYERAKTVAISAGAGALAITNAGDFIFRSRPSDAGSVELLASHVSRHHHRIGVLAEETELAQGFADLFTSAAGAAKIVREGFLPQDNEVASHLLKLRAARVDALLLLAQAEGRLALLVSTLRKLKWEVPTYSSIFPGSPSFLKIVGNEADGIVYSSLPSRDAFTPEGLKLLGEFESTKGPLLSVDYIFSVTVNAFVALETGIASGALKDTLYTQIFVGPHGSFSFDPHGDLEGMNYVLKVIENGTPRNIPTN